MFAIHDDSTETGAATIHATLRRDDLAPAERVAEVFAWFFDNEAREVAKLGAVVDDIEVFLRGGASRDDLRGDLVEEFTKFVLATSAIERTERDARFAAQLALITMESVGKSLAGRRPSARTTRRWANETAAMVSAHLGLP